MNLNNVLKYFILTVIAISLSSCVALKKDLAVTKASIEAEHTAYKEQNKQEMDALAERLKAVEGTLNQDKKKQQNQIKMSFSNIEELKVTISEINARIDAVDVDSRNSISELKTAISNLTEQLKTFSEDIDALKKGVEDSKPVENITAKEDGSFKLPEDSEKAYRQLVELTRTQSTSGDNLRKMWGEFSSKFKEKRVCDVEYWKAETFYNEEAYGSAINGFKKVVQNSKGCTKEEAAYLRITYSLYYLDKKDVARKFFDGMKVKFPKSSFPTQMKKLEELLKINEKSSGNKKATKSGKK